METKGEKIIYLEYLCCRYQRSYIYAFRHWRDEVSILGLAEKLLRSFEQLDEEEKVEEVVSIRSYGGVIKNRKFLKKDPNYFNDPKVLN